MKVTHTFLFAADLDGTLLPNGGKRAANGCLERTRALVERLQADSCPVAYVSGRHLSLARNGQRTFRLPVPDYWVCNVGTEIYDASGREEGEWTRSFGAPFDRGAILSELRTIAQVTAQEGAKQGPRKISLYYPESPKPALVARILQCARRLGNDVCLVDSIEESSGRALLDIVPTGAGKAPALLYLARKHALPKQRVFFAGDSGNDLEALTSGVCGTLVGNAAVCVRDDAERLSAETPESRLYLSGEYYGDGVIEGLKVYGLVEG